MTPPPQPTKAQRCVQCPARKDPARATILVVGTVEAQTKLGRGSLGVLLHETAWPRDLDAAVKPLVPVVLELVSLPEGLLNGAGAPLLEWMARRRPDRPLLMLTGARLVEGSGHPLRGLSLAGEGVAVASTFGLDGRSVRGVILHEVAHALGLEHCPNPICALSVRPWPLEVDDRGDTLCEPCQARWRGETEELA